MAGCCSARSPLTRSRRSPGSSAILACPTWQQVPAPPVPTLCGIAFLLAWDLWTEVRGDSRFYAGWPLALRAGLYASCLYLLAFGATTQPAAFIYFRF